MDWNYLYSLLSFLIGLAAGFQGVYEEYRKDSFKASFPLPGIFYLLSRGAVPAFLFAILYRYRPNNRPRVAGPGSFARLGRAQRGQR